MTDKKIKVAIVGGGIWGLSAAYHLAQKGQEDVVVFERNTELALETTKRAAGLVGQVRDSATMIQVTQYAIRLFQQMAEETDQRSAVEITILLGEALSDAGRSDEAVEHYLDGLAMAEANDFRPLIGELLARLGEAAPEKSERMNYLQRALTVFRELGAGARMREVQGQMHRAIMGH